MRKHIVKLFTTTIIALTLTGCTAQNNSQELSVTSTPSPLPSASTKEANEASIYEVLTAEEAKDKMDSATDYVLLDVRTAEEYAQGYIEKALLLPYDEITEKAEELLQDKSIPIFVYCRSGRRSAIAAKALHDLGYTTVYDFGGIIDWPYEIVINE